MSAVRTCTHRLCTRLGIRLSSVTKQSKHLDYDHPLMEGVRSFVAMSSQQYGVDMRLCGNFDQVWTMHYEGPRATLYKHKSKRGEFFKVNEQKPSVKTLVSSIRKALHLDDPNATSSQKEVCQPVSLNAAGNLNPIDYGRVPRTTTTLSWADGDLGRAFITMQPGAAYTT